jgi:hypothetical protein
MEPCVVHFYGIKLDIHAYPKELAETLREKRTEHRNFGVAEEIAVYILKKSGHDLSANPWAGSKEMARDTGVRVLELGDSVFLAVDDTVTKVDSWGLAKVDVQPVGMEDLLKMEQCGRWLGTDVKLGDWHMWVSAH